MKTQIFKSILPVIAFVSAITAAFAFSSAPNEMSSLVNGAKRVGSQCTNTNVQCSTAASAMICKDASGNNLFRYIGATSCPEQLWKPIN